MGEYSRLGLLIRYFLHGIAFWLLSIVLLFAWTILLIFLMTIGSVIGLLIGVILFLYFIGGINIFLSGIIWSINVSTRKLGTLAQGLVLGLLQLVTRIPVLVLILLGYAGATASSFVSTIFLFLPYCFVDGFIARKVALWWKGPPEEEINLDIRYVEDPSNMPLLCKLGFHKWQDYGDIIKIFQPEATYAQGPPRVGSLTFSNGEAVYERRKCKQCGIKRRRRLVTNSEGTLCCVGWDLDTEEINEE